METADRIGIVSHIHPVLSHRVGIRSTGTNAVVVTGLGIDLSALVDLQTGDPSRCLSSRSVREPKIIPCVTGTCGGIGADFAVAAVEVIEILASKALATTKEQLKDLFKPEAFVETAILSA